VSGNLPGWRVTFDDQPPQPLQDNQFSLDRLPPGKHTLRVQGGNGSAQVAFTVPEGAMIAPVVDQVNANNVFAVAVAQADKEARIKTSETGPLPVQVEGEPLQTLRADGIQLQNVQAGERKIVFGDAKEIRSFQVSFNPAPSLSVYLMQSATTG